LIPKNARDEMSSGGFLYVLINPSLPGLLKIGKTARDPEARASELSKATGVATPFYLAYSLSFSDMHRAEQYLHASLELRGFRVAPNREFFQMPLQVAIDALLDIRRKFGAQAGAQEIKGDQESASHAATSHPGREIYEQGIAHWFGYGEALEDMDEAIRLLDHACRLDFAPAYTSLAEYYSNWAEPPDDTAAIRYLKEGAAAGHGRCHAALALHYGRLKHFENFTKCWRNYFSSQTFMRDDDQLWTQEIFEDEGMSRINFIRQFLEASHRYKIQVPADLLRIISPFHSEVIANLHSSIRFWTSEINRADPAYVEQLKSLLAFVQQELRPEI
jgi:T5orf172 domain